ncbi:MAG: chloride channel protein, partial [Pseudomonadota bacterium]|nr:chloride channel protein [Pseudomonadota bacterium]
MLEKLRIQLATVDALPQLALMGVISGLLAGSVIILFRILTESVQASYLPQGQIEHFEILTQSYRLLIPTLGGLLIGVLFQAVPAEWRTLGIVHVIERLDYHQGHLPLRNAVLQFLGAAISIISGHSVGREGPCVHLGAASGSLLGQGLALPNNS